MRHDPVARLGAVAATLLAIGCGGEGITTPESDDYVSPMASPVVAAASHPVGVLAHTRPMPGRPFGLDVTPSGTAIVAQLDLGQVTMVDLRTRDAAEVPVGATPTGVAAIGDRWALVANQFSGDVSVVNVVTRRETSIIRVPHAPFRVLADHAGRMAYATINTGLVMFIDLADRTVVRTVPVAHAPNGLAIHGNRLYVSSVTGAITVIDRTTGAIERTIAIPQMLQDVVVDREGKHLFVASESDPYVRIVSLATGAVVDSMRTVSASAPASMQPLPAGIPAPGGTFGLALSPDGAELYATSRGLLLIFDAEARSLRRTIAIGGMLRRVAFNASGSVAVVTDENGALHFIE